MADTEHPSGQVSLISPPHFPTHIPSTSQIHCCTRVLVTEQNPNWDPLQNQSSWESLLCHPVKSPILPVAGLKSKVLFLLLLLFFPHITLASSENLAESISDLSRILNNHLHPQWLCSSAQTAITKYTAWLQKQATLSVVEAESLRPRCQWVWLPQRSLSLACLLPVPSHGLSSVRTSLCLSVCPNLLFL